LRTEFNYSAGYTLAIRGRAHGQNGPDRGYALDEALDSQNPTGRLYSEAVGRMLSVGPEADKGNSG